jgi:hypothetical protein
MTEPALSLQPSMLPSLLRLVPFQVSGFRSQVSASFLCQKKIEENTRH